MDISNLNIQEQEVKEKMEKFIDRFKNQLDGFSTGRASTKILDKVVVEFYGEKVHISRVATLSVQSNSTLVVQVWDKSLVKVVEKSIADANLGLSTSSDGQLIRVNVPPLNEARRKELVKLLHKDSEDSKISIRNVRRDYIDLAKKQEKEHLISEDEKYDIDKKIQKITDSFIKKIDEITASKEKEIMQI